MQMTSKVQCLSTGFLRQQFNSEYNIVDVLVLLLLKFRSNISNIDHQIEFVNSGFLMYDSEEEKEKSIKENFYDVKIF